MKRDHSASMKSNRKRKLPGRRGTSLNPSQWKKRERRLERERERKREAEEIART